MPNANEFAECQFHRWGNSPGKTGSRFAVDLRCQHSSGQQVEVLTF
jgi:hypothetical protein